MSTANRQLSTEPCGRVVVGVDTHQDKHVAVALDVVAGVLGHVIVATTKAGFASLLAWAQAFGQVLAFGIEGTGSYGATLADYLHKHNVQVIEVSQTNRADRRKRGKSDVLDAENIARAVLANQDTSTPKTHDGASEALRPLKSTYTSAVAARTRAMNAIKAELNHDLDLKAEVKGLSGADLADHLASLRPRGYDTPELARRQALKRLARRWLELDAEASELDAMIAQIIKDHAPRLLATFGVGPQTAAAILVAVGDNPERITSESALAHMAGTAPVPTGSGKTSGRYRLNRGGNRQLNCALYQIVIVRMRWDPATKDYVARRLTEHKHKPEIIRCLKRYVTREIYQIIKAPNADQITGEIPA